MKNFVVLITTLLISSLAYSADEADKDCRFFHFLHTTAVNISSPGYPQEYPVSKNCEWNFEAEPGARIKITFYDFAVEGQRSCNADYVAIYDGSTIDDPLIGKYCGSQKLPPIISTRNRMLMVFHSDDSVRLKGFKASLEIDCRFFHFLNRTALSIRSPNYPLEYPSSKNCQWNFEAEPGEKIIATFHDFAIEYQGSCNADYVAIYDGSTRDDPLLGKFCGLEKPPPVVSTGNTMLMVFHSDDSVILKGFKASVEIDCLFFYTLNETAVNISSPNYPSEYPVSKSCHWYFEANPRNSIKITFYDFQIEEQGECNADYVSLYDGSTRNDPLLGRFCGREIPLSIVSTTNKMLMIFHSDYSVRRKGFLASLETEPRDSMLDDPAENIQAQITVMAGDKVIFFNRTWVLNIPSNSSLYQALENLGTLEPDYKAQYKYFKGKLHVTGVNKFSDDYAHETFWFIHSKPLSSTGPFKLIEQSPEDIKMDEAKEMILWYRSSIIKSSELIFIDSNEQYIVTHGLLD